MKGWLSKGLYDANVKLEINRKRRKLNRVSVGIWFLTMNSTMQDMRGRVYDVDVCYDCSTSWIMSFLLLAFFSLSSLLC